MTQAKEFQNKKLYSVEVYNVKINFLKRCWDYVLIAVFTKAVKWYFFLKKKYIATSRREHTAQHIIP